jgi:hypothetical protein
MAKSRSDFMQGAWTVSSEARAMVVLVLDDERLDGIRGLRKA